VVLSTRRNWLLAMMFRASQHQTVGSMAAVAHGRYVSHRIGACTEGVSRRNIQPDTAIRCGRPPRRTKNRTQLEERMRDLLERLVIRLAEMLDRNVIMVPEVDET
jgi:hypothetical protein